MFRRAALFVHRWVGLTLGLVAVLTGLTGALLVFRHEIDAGLMPHLKRVPVSAAPVSAGQMRAAVNAAYPDAALKIANLPRASGDSAEFWLRDGRIVFVDPGTGRVLGDAREEETLTGRLFDLHTKLFAGDRGKTVVGVVGAGLFLLSLSGIVTWWPRRNQRARDGLRVKWSAGGKRRNYDLHRAGGFYASWILLVITTTGMALVWPEPVRAVAARLDGAEAKKPKVKGSGEPLPLDTLLAAADQALPGGRLSRITFPAKPTDPLGIRKQFPHELHPNGMSSVAVDPYTAKVLAVDPDAQAGAGKRLLNARYPLHLGLYGGIVTRVLHLFAGLSPAVLFVTGLLLWLAGRRRAKRMVRSASASSPGI